MTIKIWNRLTPAAIRLFAAAATLVVSASFPSASHAAGEWWQTHDGCLFTEHRDARGEELIVDTGYTYSYVGGHWNDRISAIICEVYCVATVWEHRDYQGASRTFENSSYVGSAWNDQISSLSVYCEP